MTDALALRQAVREDAYALWLWANDAATREASHGRAPVPWDAHVAWLDARLHHPHALVLVGTVDGGRPVGTVRFDTADAWGTARLSYVVAPEARGAGLGRSLVDAGVRRLRDRHPAAHVVADVMRANERSARVFRALGWTERAVDADTLRFHDASRQRGGER